MSVSNNEESVLGATAATAAGGVITAGLLSNKSFIAAMIVAGIATLTVVGIVIYKKVIKKNLNK